VEAGWPNSTNMAEVEYFRRIRREKLGLKVVAFGRTRKPRLSPEEDKDLRILAESEPDAITVMGKSWRLHIEKVLGASLQENLDMISDTVKYLRGFGYQVFFDAEHFFDGCREDQGYAMRVVETAAGAGASTIVLCDTRGVSTPMEVYDMTEIARSRTQTPLGVHAHNDRGLATVNSIFSLLAGAQQVQGTINGIGERCGNADLIEVIGNLELSLGYRTGLDVSKLCQISDYVYEIANLSPNPYKPFVGRFAFAHKGGVHAHAVMKLPEAYEGFDPEVVGNKRSIAVSSQSGISNVISKARDFGFSLDPKSPQARSILKKIKEMESQGYHYENANASLNLLYARELGVDLHYFDLINWRAHVLWQGDEITSESSVKINIGDESVITAAEGNGPVNAFDIALKKALRTQYPELSRVELVGYRVRELAGEMGTAAAVQVFVEFQADGERWSTIGVSANILKASEEALTDGYTYYLYRLNAARRRR
ncbi:MAG: citramalate synthase, partial [Candidatus Bathyarchaeia archaeon]